MSDATPSLPPKSQALADQRVALVGRFAGMSQRELAKSIEQHGGSLSDKSPTLVVIGDESNDKQIEAARRLAKEVGCSTLSEADLLGRLDLIAPEHDIRRLYTSAMLAELASVPVAAIRRWGRRGHLQATRRLNRLAYYDFSEATIARLLGELLAAGRSLDSIDRFVDQLTRAYPEMGRPLGELPIVIEEGILYVRHGDTLSEPSGQLRLDFDLSEENAEEDQGVILSIGSPDAEESEEEPVDESRRRALAYCELGELEEAIAAWRLVLLQGNPVAEDHFTLGEWLYLAGEPQAARERYYAALELDEEYVEARMNLGCVLDELGQSELAVSAFLGALDRHPQYADAHFHLAAALDRQGNARLAEIHWRQFLEIAPESPWADEARLRLEGPQGL